MLPFSANDRAARHREQALPFGAFCWPQSLHAHGCFEDAGFELSVRHIQLFDCYRAEWRETAGGASGAVVGQTADEASVYALSQLRRSLVSHAGSLPSVT